MTDLVLRALERVHGHLGWLAAAALVHPAVVLRGPARRAPLAASLATLLVTVVAALGAWIYPVYRSRLKQEIFVRTPSIGWAFERKEHLAAGAVLLAWAGLMAHLVSVRLPGGPRRTSLWRSARLAYAAAAVLAGVTSALGVLVASHRSF